MPVVFKVVALAAGGCEGQQVAVDRVDEVARLAAQFVCGADELAVGVVFVGYGRAIALFDSDGAAQSAFAFEVVGLFAAQAVGDDGGVFLVLKAVVECAGVGLQRDSAVVVVFVAADGLAPWPGVGHHAAGELRVVVEAARLRAVAPMDGGQLAPGGVLVAHYSGAQAAVTGVVGKVHGCQPDAAVAAPALSAFVCGDAGQFDELQPVAPPSAVLHAGDGLLPFLVFAAGIAQCVAKAVDLALQQQALAFDVRCGRFGLLGLLGAGLIVK